VRCGEATDSGLPRAIIPYILDSTYLVLLVLIISWRSAASSTRLLVTLYVFSMLPWWLPMRGDLTMTRDQVRKGESGAQQYSRTRGEITTARVVVEAMGAVRRWLFVRGVDALIPKLVDVGGSGLAPCGVTASNRWKPHHSTSIEHQTRQARSDSYTLLTEQLIPR
jgi:hypothetical protein